MLASWTLGWGLQGGRQAPRKPGGVGACWHVLPAKWGPSLLTALLLLLGPPLRLLLLLLVRVCIPRLPWPTPTTECNLLLLLVTAAMLLLLLLLLQDLVIQARHGRQRTAQLLLLHHLHPLSLPLAPISLGHHQPRNCLPSCCCSH